MGYRVDGCNYKIHSNVHTCKHVPLQHHQVPSWSRLTGRRRPREDQKGESACLNDMEGPINWKFRAYILKGIRV